MKNEKIKSIEKYSAPALSKGLDILELLATHSSGMKKSEIAKTLDRSISEIFRMLAVLVDRDYVSVDEDSERYSLTLKLFAIAHKHPPVRRLTNVAADIMAELAIHLNQSVHLAILDGDNILVIAQNDPPGNNITSVRLGARIPVTQTASGAVLCAQLNASAIDDICAQNENATDKHIQVFKENVAQSAKNGVCISPSMVIGGVQNISVPIIDYSNRIVACITIPYIQRLISKDDPSLEEAKKSMLQIGNRISKMLGSNMASDKIEKAQ